MTDKLDYIKGLGTTSIWLTPSFKNRPVQGSGANASAGYHGYWITDFTQIDPHLGTNAEMKTLIAKAHAKGMKVFFDIITNHTADVIDYANPNAGGASPTPTSARRSRPYKDGRRHRRSTTRLRRTSRSRPWTPTPRSRTSRCSTRRPTRPSRCRPG